MIDSRYIRKIVIGRHHRITVWYSILHSEVFVHSISGLNKANTLIRLKSTDLIFINIIRTIFVVRFMGAFAVYTFGHCFFAFISGVFS